jgi:hypothetical protein
VTKRLRAAIRMITFELVGVQKIKVEADPLYGIEEHERWYPKACLVDTNLLIELDAALKEADANPKDSRKSRVRKNTQAT